jgi:hypothetical protein
MGVVRARVIFPYKVGHLFNPAGPLRADLVKSTIASRDIRAAGGRRTPLLRCPGAPCGVFSRRGGETGGSVGGSTQGRMWKGRGIYMQRQCGQVSVGVG